MQLRGATTIDVISMPNRIYILVR